MGASTRERRTGPGWHFVLVVVGVGLVLQPLFPIPELFDPLAPLELLTARVTAALVGGCGMVVERDGVVLRHPAGFSYEIYYRCTGLLVAILLAAGLLALPGRMRPKLGAVLLGAAAVFAVNFLRLVSLFYIGVRHPAAFETAHAIVGEAAMIALVLAIWAAWFRTQDAAGLAASPSSLRSRKRRSGSLYGQARAWR